MVLYKEFWNQFLKKKKKHKLQNIKEIVRNGTNYTMNSMFYPQAKYNNEEKES